MSYTDFVWFLLSEEDKRHPTAIEYWFRCMDLDGDGFLSMYELEYFYEEQMHRMEAIGIETLPFQVRKTLKNLITGFYCIRFIFFSQICRSSQFIFLLTLEVEQSSLLFLFYLLLKTFIDLHKLLV